MREASSASFSICAILATHGSKVFTPGIDLIRDL